MIMKKIAQVTLLCASLIGGFSTLECTRAITMRGAPVVAGTATPSAAVQSVQNTIMQVIVSNPDFKAELATIQKFIATPSVPATYLSYNYILQKIDQSTNASEAIGAIEILEKAIMHKYHYDAYLIGCYTPGVSIFFSGIKYSYLNPLAWFSAEDKTATALLNELQYLSKIAEIHSMLLAKRLALTVESYRHWKRNMAIAIAVYFAADALGRGWKNSSLESLRYQGLSGGSAVAQKFGENVITGSQATASAAAYLGRKSYQLSQPLVKAICYGASGFAESTPPNKTSHQDHAQDEDQAESAISISTLPKQLMHGAAYLKDITTAYAQNVSELYQQIKPSSTPQVPLYPEPRISEF